MPGQDVLERLRDLRRQATEERSHYYTGSVLTHAIREIERLRGQLPRRVQRPLVHERETDDILDVLREILKRRVAKHGPGAYAGPHEALGILLEEFKELTDAVQANDATAAWGEMLDIAVGAVFGMASLYVTGHLAESQQRDKA